MLLVFFYSVKHIQGTRFALSRLEASNREAALSMHYVPCDELDEWLLQERIDYTMSASYGHYAMGNGYYSWFRERLLTFDSHEDALLFKLRWL